MRDWRHTRIWLLAATSGLWLACSGASTPAHGPGSTPTADAASAEYTKLVIDDYRVLGAAWNATRDGCLQVSDAGCDAKVAVTRTAAQKFLDDLASITVPSRLQIPHTQLVSGLNQLVPALDAMKSAIAAHNGDAYSEAIVRAQHAVLAINASTYDIAPNR
jgi:hypothetical protein